MKIAVFGCSWSHGVKEIDNFYSNTNSYSPKRGIMTKEDGTPYNAGKDDWNEARNAELLKEVRVSMMKGEWHPECTRCKKEEESGMRSRREYENDDWGSIPVI